MGKDLQDPDLPVAVEASETLLALTRDPETAPLVHPYGVWDEIQERRGTWRVERAALTLVLGAVIGSCIAWTQAAGLIGLVALVMVTSYLTVQAGVFVDAVAGRGLEGLGGSWRRWGAQGLRRAGAVATLVGAVGWAALRMEASPVLGFLAAGVLVNFLLLYAAAGPVAKYLGCSEGAVLRGQLHPVALAPGRDPGSGAFGVGSVLAPRLRGVLLVAVLLPLVSAAPQASKGALVALVAGAMGGIFLESFGGAVPAYLYRTMIRLGLRPPQPGSGTAGPGLPEPPPLDETSQ